MNTDQDIAISAGLTDPTLDAQAHGDAGLKPHEGPHGGPRDHTPPHLREGGPGEGPKGPKHDVGHHHRKAAEHHERAAQHHREAAAAHDSGSTDTASTHATKAFGHGAHAQHHATDALKRYADKGE